MYSPALHSRDEDLCQISLSKKMLCNTLMAHIVHNICEK